ncbi:hypothetical protein E1B28_006750 [Marasmius oreades]|uniref:Uncharacterized protein n=1 Tax=Marasmius oreades TaxID=181124 RepID=A0A9P7UWS0_9AGAR|nr:uncharacterized protein E1B28_006750 [Marasmius oreades]KAG7096070.1 hypothetical protein E1B28_006750 [Marasmius oreades]
MSSGMLVTDLESKFEAASTGNKLAWLNSRPAPSFTPKDLFDSQFRWILLLKVDYMTQPDFQRRPKIPP